MKRCSLREWIPIVPIPVWPLAWQCLLGQNTVVGSMRCSFWLCVEACQEEYVGIPIFTTSALHHGSGQRYHPFYRSGSSVFRGHHEACLVVKVDKATSAHGGRP